MAEEALDLRADLGAQFDAAETGGTDATTGATTESTGTGSDSAAPDAAAAALPSGEGSTDGAIRDPATGRFVPRSTDAAQGNAADTQQAAQQQTTQPAQGEQAAQQQAATQTPQVDLPPSTWSASAKAAYNALPDVVRGEIKKREADFQRGITQYKEAADFGTRLQTLAQPYAPMINAAGGHERVIADLLNTNYRLITSTPQEKAQLLLDVARRFGADMSAFGGQQQQAQQGAQGIDPQAIQEQVQRILNPHLQRFDTFQNQQLTAQQQREQQQQQELQGQIQAFQNAAGENGQPKHIYFENVRGTMAALIESGNAKSLEDAYEMACRANPEVNRLVLAEQRKAEDAERLRATQRAAEDARRAIGANVSGQGAIGMADSSKRSLRDDLAAAWDGGGRV